MGKLKLKSKHRLLCGDSTDAAAVLRLLGGRSVCVCFTSPPYAQQRDYGAAKSAVQDWDALMQGVFAALDTSPNCQVLVNLGMVHKECEWVPYWDAWIEWMASEGWRRFAWYVWDQGPGMPGDWNGRLAPSHEFVFHFNRESVKPSKARDCKHAGSMHAGSGQRGKDGIVKERHAGKAPVQAKAILDSVVRVNRQGAAHDAGGHPAPFPVGLPAHFIMSWEGLVYDPFSGSGTTLVACEQLDRQFCGMELDPAYCDIAVARYEALTGEKAVLCG